jgi:hypothetical protein
MRISPMTSGEHDWPPAKYVAGEDEERISWGE